MKKLGIFFFLILWIGVFAQKPVLWIGGVGQNEDFTYGDAFFFEKGTEQRVVVEHAKVREAPLYKARQIDSLQINTPIKILNITTENYTMGIRKAPWYEVSYRKGNEQKTGYLWGGNLALAYGKKDQTEYLLGAIGTIDLASSLNSRLVLHVKLFAFENGKQVDQISFSWGELNFISMTIGDNKGLEGVKTIVRIDNVGEACGVPTLTNYYLWTGKTFYPLNTLTNVSDAGVFYSSAEYIFPSDKGGKKSQIIMKAEAAEFDENEKLIKKEKFKATFLWTGERVILQKPNKK